MNAVYAPRRSGFVVGSLPAALVALAPAFLAAAALAQTPAAEPPPSERGSYSYVLAVEGNATLFAGGSDSRTPVETNLPVLTGDRLWTSPQGRLDVYLSDGNRVSLDGDTEVLFEKLAFSPDTQEQATTLRLLQGSIALEVGFSGAGSDALAVDTANTRVYLPESGTYLVTASRSDWTRVITRKGVAEVVDQRGSSVVRAGEELHVEGYDQPRARLASASQESAFERWSADQAVRLAATDDTYLDEPIRARAGDLDEHGEWVTVDQQTVWRPAVSVGWRPYWQGHWYPSPAGLYWVSSDPWSSITYHYGSWNYNSYYGWLWYPGYRWAPAHVYWYWGPTYAAWIPSAYYHHYYYPYYRPWGYYWGVYGWVGGSWSPFRHWVYCPVRYIGWSGEHHHHGHGSDLDGSGTRPDGILTTDTRGLTRDILERPALVRETLERNWRREGSHGDADLPDVTAFVERRPELPAEVRDRTLVSTPAGGRRADLAAGARPAPRRSDTAGVSDRPGSHRPDRAGTSTRPSHAGPSPTEDTEAGRTLGRPVVGAGERQSPVAANRPAIPARETAAGATGSEQQRRPALQRQPSVPAPSGAGEPSPARRVLDGIRGRRPVAPAAPVPAQEPRVPEGRPARTLQPSPRPAPSAQASPAAREPGPRPTAPSRPTFVTPPARDSAVPRPTPRVLPSPSVGGQSSSPGPRVYRPSAPSPSPRVTPSAPRPGVPSARPSAPAPRPSPRVAPSGSGSRPSSGTVSPRGTPSSPPRSASPPPSSSGGSRSSAAGSSGSRGAAPSRSPSRPSGRPPA